MNIELAVKEITRLQQTDMLEAIPALMAAYSTNYVKEKSRAVLNSTLFKDSSFTVNSGYIVPISSSSIKRIYTPEHVPSVCVSIRPGFFVSDGLTKTQILNIFDSIVALVDRLHDTCVMHVLGSSGGQYVLDPKEEDYAKTISHIFMTDVANEVPEAESHEIYRRCFDTAEWFEFHLSMKLSMAVGLR